MPRRITAQLFLFTREKLLLAATYTAMKLVIALILCALSMCASTVSANLFAPTSPKGITPVIVHASLDAAGQVSGVGYSLVFAGDAGVVQGSAWNAHAVPVAGMDNTTPTYLTGDFGSTSTPDIAASSPYLSTGRGSITISFAQPQRSFALLWGSVDAGNSLTFDDGAHTYVTGAAVQRATAGFVGEGYQGPGGSAYVVIDTDTPFETVIASSNVVSFELAGVVAAAAPLVDAAEPSSASLISVVVLSLCMWQIGRRLHTYFNRV